MLVVYANEPLLDRGCAEPEVFSAGKPLGRRDIPVVVVEMVEGRPRARLTIDPDRLSPAQKRALVPEASLAKDAVRARNGLRLRLRW